MQVSLLVYMQIQVENRAAFTYSNTLFVSPGRCDLGDPERGGGRPPGRHAAAFVFPGRVQHPAQPKPGRRLQPLRLSGEDQVPQQQQQQHPRCQRAYGGRGTLAGKPQRAAARAEWTLTQLCGYTSKQSTKQSVSSLI